MRLAKLIVYGFCGLFILLGVIASFWTIIPDSNQVVNFVGTQTHCPIVPYSTYGAIVGAVIGAVASLLDTNQT